MTTGVYVGQYGPMRLSAEVGAEIRAMMARRGYTGVRLARELGVSQPWVSERLRGHTAITLNDLDAIADVLQVSVLDLFPANLSRSTPLYLAGVTEIGNAPSRRPTHRTVRHPDDPAIGVRRTAPLREPIAA